jgi:PncC family amidohydrolase
VEDKAKALVTALKEQGCTITTAESCTGGRIAAAITGVPGSSAVFPGGIVSYCNQVKHQLLEVPEELLNTYGAVSEPVARAMAQGAAKLLNTDLALSATGLAGPDGDGVSPVGTVYLGVSFRGSTQVGRFVFPGDRAQVQAQATEKALELALEAVSGDRLLG